jgi:hypothetical protein
VNHALVADTPLEVEAMMMVIVLETFVLTLMVVF